MKPTSTAINFSLQHLAFSLSPWLAAGLLAATSANAQLPDLAVVSVSWTGQPVAGQPLAVSMVVTNVGAGVALGPGGGGYYDAFVLSSNATLAGAAPNGTFTSGNGPVYFIGYGVAPNGGYTDSGTVTLPDVPAGQYYLIGVADYYNWVTESDTNNNTLAVPITLAIPDLVVASVTWTGQPVAGQQFSASMVVSNIGSGFADGAYPYTWGDTFVLSSNSTLAGAIPGGMGENYGFNLNVPPNGSYTSSATWTLPDVPAGQYYLIGVAAAFGDYGIQLFEATTNNNSLAVPITLAIPDLAVASVSWTGQPVAGQQLAVSMVVTNIGSGFAGGGWFDAFVLSTSRSLADAVPGGGIESELASYQLLLPNGSYTNSASLTLPSVPTGQYFLIGVADDRNYLAEGDETNNTLAVPITIGTVDLIATNLTVGNSPAAGESLSFSFGVTNIAVIPFSGYWYDSLTLSSNATLAGAITTWEFYGDHDAPPGGGYAVSQTVTLPAIAQGNYYLIAQADDRNLVPEDDKTNNMTALEIFVTNIPPSVSLLTPSSSLSLTSCVPVLLNLAAQAQTGSFPIANVRFYNGSNLLAQFASAPYQTNAPLPYGANLFTAVALDAFGLQATSLVANVTLNWPGTNQLLLNRDSNGDCVICMSAQAGSNYVVQAATALQSPGHWQPYLTNPIVLAPVGGPILIFTNHPALPQLFFRAVMSP